MKALFSTVLLWAGIFVPFIQGQENTVKKVEEKIQLVRDTVFIEVTREQSNRLIDLEAEGESLKKEKFKKKKKSQKIEFVFGEKPLDKPLKNHYLLLINEFELAANTTRDNKSNVLTIPITKN